MSVYQRWWPKLYLVVWASILGWIGYGRDVPAFWDGLWIITNVVAMAYLLAWARDEGKKRREKP